MKRTLLFTTLLAFFVTFGQAQELGATGNQTPSADNARSMAGGQIGDNTKLDSCNWFHLLTNGKELPEKINKEFQATRTILNSSAAESITTLKEKASMGAVSLLTYGVESIAKLITRKETRKKEWREAVQNQNVWSDTITNIVEVKDFYSKVSKLGALDPQNMQFDGFDFKYYSEDGELAFQLRCSVDTTVTGIAEITRHGKFLLTLDTLFINPYICHLPTSRSAEGYTFEFEKGAQEVKYTATFVLTASWMTQAIEYFRDQEVGRFTLSFTLRPDLLNQTDRKGRKTFLYTSGTDVPASLSLTGESLILPRSYLGISENEEGQTDDIWSNGQFNVKLALKEYREIKDDYWMDKSKRPKYWNDDYKKRTKYQAPKLFKSLKQITGIDGQTTIVEIVTAGGEVAAEQILGVSSSSSSSSAQPSK